MNELHKKQILVGRTNVAPWKNSFNKVNFDQVAKRQVKQIMQEFVKTTND